MEVTWRDLSYTQTKKHKRRRSMTSVRAEGGRRSMVEWESIGPGGIGRAEEEDYGFN